MLCFIGDGGVLFWHEFRILRKVYRILARVFLETLEALIMGTFKSASLFLLGLFAVESVSAQLFHNPFNNGQNTSMRVSKTTWSFQDEADYSAFVQRLGRSKCRNVDSCIRSEANPYRASDPSSPSFYSDCADFPYFLRMYFAWKNELPFAYATVPTPLIPPNALPEELPVNGKMDPRYSKWGNMFTSRRSLTPRSAGASFDFFSEAAKLQDNVSTASFRHNPELTEGVPTDFYSVAITKESLTPGTVIYDPKGHVVVIYDILESGKILFFAAHPDNTVSRGSFSAEMMRSNPNHGAGFRKFRPFQIVGAKKASDGSIYGGRPQYVDNLNIPDFSVAQYYGTERDPVSWSKGKFVVAGKDVDFASYVQMTLAITGFKIDPVSDFESGLGELCEAVKQRITAVDVALAAGVQNMPHMDPLPGNIFGASGEWENFSSPSRDIRLKIQYQSMMQKVYDYYQKIGVPNSNMEYRGTDLRNDLLLAYKTASRKCKLSYTNSAGAAVPLSLESVNTRLYKMSFSPYHCAERRWGADGSEAKTCTDDSVKTRWYQAQQFLRNSMVRDPETRMGWSLADLEGGQVQTNTGPRPNLDLKAYLESIPKP